MENTLVEPNIGLIIWQILIIILTVFITIITFRLYKKVTKYLDLKIEYLTTKIKSEQ